VRTAARGPDPSPGLQRAFWVGGRYRDHFDADRHLHHRSQAWVALAAFFGLGSLAVLAVGMVVNAQQTKALLEFPDLMDSLVAWLDNISAS